MEDITGGIVCSFILSDWLKSLVHKEDGKTFLRALRHVLRSIDCRDFVYFIILTSKLSLASRYLSLHAAGCHLDRTIVRDEGEGGREFGVDPGLNWCYLPLDIYH